MVARLGVTVSIFAVSTPLTAQVDDALARRYFAEALALCEAERGRLWGVSLCGPMVFADAATQTIATNQPPPDAERPRALGFANAALRWGSERWAAFVWQHVSAADELRRAELMLHELFHRVQFDLGQITPNGNNEHMDTLEGRYWIRLEWRALAEALRTSAEDHQIAIRDALAFRAARRAAFPDAAENERREEVREGLAQYTATTAASPTRTDALASALRQLDRAEEEPTYVRRFAYTTGMAYGLLLDTYAPGWTRAFEPASDLAALLRDAAGAEPTDDVDGAARRFGGSELMAQETQLDRERRARVAELRARFVEGPVLVVPRGRSASFVTTGATPIPGEGTVMATYRVSGEWGSLEADWVLVSTDGETLRLPAPADATGSTLTGPGWTVRLAPGWVARPGARAGDLAVTRANGPPEMGGGVSGFPQPSS